MVAEACIQALDIDFTEGQAYEINSVEVSFQDSVVCLRTVPKIILFLKIKTKSNFV